MTANPSLVPAQRWAPGGHPIEIHELPRPSHRSDPRYWAGLLQMRCALSGGQGCGTEGCGG